MVERPRAVIFGPGYIGALHADALRWNGVDVVGFVGTGSEAGRCRADAFRVPFFSSRADALASELVDCVHITTRNHLHAPLARHTIAAGEHRAWRQSRGVGRNPSCVVLGCGRGHFGRGLQAQTIQPIPMGCARCRFAMRLRRARETDAG